MKEVQQRRLRALDMAILAVKESATWNRVSRRRLLVSAKHYGTYWGVSYEELEPIIDMLIDNKIILVPAEVMT